MRTYVIAEVGSCHDGSISMALALVEAARDAGVDAVKFQFWSDPDALADRRRVPKQYREVYRRYRVPAQWLPRLAGEAHRCRLDFMCTAYLPQDVAVVAPHVRHFKMASFEAEARDLTVAHEPFLMADVEAGVVRWLVVSLGMGASWNAVGAFERFDLLAPRLKFLHCVSAYPAPVEALNLRAIRDAEFGLEPDGFSDHSDPSLTWTGALAVAAGAEIVEAHLRLPATDDRNPDAPHAMSPRQFADYVKHVRFAEACMGEGPVGGARPCEAEMAQYRVTGQ